MIELNDSRNLVSRPCAGCFLALTEPIPGRKPLLLMELFWAAVLVLPVFGAHAGVVFTTLYSFTGMNDGANPQAGLVQGSDGSFYGTTMGGGTSYFGTVFKVSTNGTLTSLYSFIGGTDGWGPAAGLAQGRDGSFYGTTIYGGTDGGYGTIFKITTDGVLATLYSFNLVDYGWYELNKASGLVQGRDGSFYGTTVGNLSFKGVFGAAGYGTVFQISTNGELTRS